MEVDTAQACKPCSKVQVFREQLQAKLLPGVHLAGDLNFFTDREHKKVTTSRRRNNDFSFSESERDGKLSVDAVLTEAVLKNSETRTESKHHYHPQACE